MSARDAEMAEAIRSGSLGTSEIVAAVLSAGYSKPRTITTVEELDALPQDTVVRDAEGYVYDRDQIVIAPHPLRWHPAGVAADVDSAVITLPATVLYTPKES